MGTSVWYLIASLLLILVNAETNDSSPSPSEQTETSTPAPSRPLTAMKELVLYLTPEQAKILEDAGAIVRPFPQFENAFLQQQLQQSVEEHTETQSQPTSTDGDVKQGIGHPDEFYKVINIQQLNEDLTVATTEKPRPKYKYVPKSRQQEYAATYVQKKNNKTKGYSTEYVRYLPNFEVENLKMEPYRAQPIPGYYYQNSIQNTEPPTYLNPDALNIEKTEEIQVNKEVPQIQEIQQKPIEFQTQVENLKSIEIEKVEVIEPQEIYQSQDNQKTQKFDVQQLEYNKPKQPVVTQKIEKVQQQEETNKPQDIQIPQTIQRLEHSKKSERPVEIQKLEEVTPQKEIYKPKYVQRPHNIQRLEFIKKPNRPVEIQKLEEVQPQLEVYKPLDTQRQRNFRRLKYFQKSKRPVEIQKLEEVQRYEDFQRPIHIQGPYRPVEIQKHEEVQRYEEIQRPLEIQTPYRTLVFQRHEEVQRPENIQPFIEISSHAPEIEQVRVQQPIESVEQIHTPFNDKRPVTFERQSKTFEINRGSAVLGQSDNISAPLEFQIPLEDKVNTGSLMEEHVETSHASPAPLVLDPTVTINDQFSSLLAPLVQHEKIAASIAQHTELVNSERVIQDKLQQLKQSGIVDGPKLKAELDKLNKNLEEQNALAEKLALEAISNKQNSPISPKENISLDKRPSLETKGRDEILVPTSGPQIPSHSQFKEPQPHTVPLGIERPIPVPVLQSGNAELKISEPTERVKLIPTPEIRNVFIDFPFLVQGDNGLPVNYPIYDSDNFAVLRELWEH